MGISSLLRKLIGIAHIVCLGWRLEGSDLIVNVRPSWRYPRCGKCGKRAPGYDQRKPSRCRHLTFGVTRFWLEYAPRRVDCPTCGIHHEQVPWADLGSRFTRPMQDLVAYMAQTMDKTAVTKLMGISWRTVGTIVENVVSDRMDETRFKNLRCIGIDEFSYRKNHRYITTVVDHDRQRVIWTGKGRSSKTLNEFVDLVGEENLKKIKHVTMDMAGGYIKAVTERLPDAEIVFDRFHVQKLVSEALDKVRRNQVRETEDPQEAKKVKKSRFPLLKNPWNLTPKEKNKLATIQQSNKPLYRAYLLKEALAAALDYRQPKRAREALDNWLAWASRSKLKPFITVARTIRKYK